MAKTSSAPIEISLFGDLLPAASAPVAHEYPLVNTTSTPVEENHEKGPEQANVEQDAARREKDQAAAALIGTWGHWLCGRVKHEVSAIGRGPTIVLNGRTITLNYRMVITKCGEKFKVLLWTQKEQPGVRSCPACAR